jgi:selenide,water dikinase
MGPRSRRTRREHRRFVQRGAAAAPDDWRGHHATGGEPVVAVNLLAWPRDRIPFELATEVLRGGSDVDPARMLRNDTGTAGTPLTLTKPLGLDGLE